MNKLIATLLLGAMMSSPALADERIPDNLCLQPFAVNESASQADADTFNEELNAYKACMVEFIEAQKKAAEVHQMAIADARLELEFIESQGY